LPGIPPRAERIDYAQVERFAKLGLTAPQIAARLRLDPEAAESEEFREAVEYWRSVGVSEIAARCFELAAEGNTRAITFLLKAVGGWSETSRRPTKESDGAGSRWDKFLLSDAAIYRKDADA